MTDASVVLLSAGIAGFVGLVPVLIKGRADAVAARERRRIEAEDREQARADREELRKVASRAEVAARKVEEVAVAAAEVKETLNITTAANAAALDQLADGQRVALKVANDTHVLVNSQYGAALRLTATSARVLADTTGRPEHRVLAETAEAALAEHMRRQAAVDQAPAAAAATPGGGTP